MRSKPINLYLRVSTLSLSLSLSLSLCTCVCVCVSSSFTSSSFPNSSSSSYYSSPYPPPLPFSPLGPKLCSGKRPIFVSANGDFNSSQPQGLLSVFLISKDFSLEKAEADRNLDLILLFRLCAHFTTVKWESIFFSFPHTS